LANESLTSRTVFRFYYPLALSWLFMGLDGPISVAVLSDLPYARVNTAAFLIIIAVAMWIESPVIDLLSTATTLGKDGPSLAVLNRFVAYLVLWVTLAHAFVTLTSAYWVITEQILGVKPDVAQAARFGLAIMLPWSGFIGWRRSRQGLLIRNGATRLIGIGTLLRVTVLIIADWTLARWSGFSGIVTASIGLLSSVAAEAIFTHFVSRPTVAKVAATPATGPVLSMRKLFGFHMPLTATTMMKLMTGPVVAAGLARSFQPTHSLAAYEVAGTVLFLFRAIAFCLPEVVIALYSNDATRPVLRKFSLAIGAASSGLLLFLGITRLDVFIFTKLLHAQADLAEMGHWMFLTSALAPLLDACMAYVLGVLTAHHLTMARMAAVLGSSVLMAATVAVTVSMKLAPPLISGLAMTVALSSELLILAIYWRNARPGPVGSFAPVSEAA